MFGNRDNNYLDRVSETIISGAVGFVNESTAGATFSGVADNSTIIVNGENTSEGYVTRFNHVESGPDGAVLITVADGGSAIPKKQYVNAIMVKELVADTDGGCLIDGLEVRLSLDPLAGRTTTSMPMAIC